MARLASLLLLIFFLGHFSTFGQAENLGDECSPGTLDKCDAAQNLVCDAADRKCVCKPRYFQDVNMLCTEALGSKCAAAYKECNLIPYALCDDNGDCSCTNNYKPNEVFCMARNLGDHCLESDQCPENAACVGEKCICNTGFVPDGDVCREVVEYLGDECSVDGQCTGMEPQSECSGILPPKTCKCQDKYFVNDGLNEKCLPIARKLGESCSLIAQCSANFGSEARCDGGKCVCKSGNVPSIDLVNCLPTQPLKGGCVQDQQCSSQVDGSECFQLKCVCKSNYDEILGKCSKRPELIGETCMSDSQCALINVEAKCENSTCQCGEGYVATPDFKKCLPGAYLVGSPCTNNVQCSANITNSACEILTSTCACNSGFVPAANKTSCFPRVGGILADCVDDGQCLAAVSGEVACISKKCQCKTDNHYLADACWNTRRLGDSCRATQECRLARYSERAECSSLQICECKTGLIADKVKNECNSGALMTANILLVATALFLARKSW